MKTTNLKLVFGSFLMLFLITSCKNETKTENTPTSEVTSTAADAENKGQAFIEDDGSTPNVLQIAIGSPDHTTLVAAVKSAGLVETLQGDGPFTVFAPTNDAFENLPEGTVNTLLEKKNKATLSGILTYHVVAGTWDSKKLMDAIKKSKDGVLELKTVNGAKLWVMKNGPSNLILKDEKGNMTDITIRDVYQSNGVIHVVDAVLMPTQQGGGAAGRWRLCDQKWRSYEQEQTSVAERSGQWMRSEQRTVQRS